jgi:transcriptional regulator with XRE-family HTH domain
MDSNVTEGSDMAQDSAVGTLVDAKRLNQALLQFRKRVQETRRRRGLDQYEAAARAGISQSQWSKIERGEAAPSLANALRMQIALGIPSIETFFGRHPSAQLAKHTPEDED